MAFPIQVKGRSPEEIKASEAKKQKEEEDNKLKKLAAPKQKKYYDIKLECTMPVLLTYRVLADDEHDALIQMKRQAPSDLRPNISQKRDIKATIRESGSSIIKHIKNFYR